MAEVEEYEEKLQQNNRVIAKQTDNSCNAFSSICRFFSCGRKKTKEEEFCETFAHIQQRRQALRLDELEDLVYGQRAGKGIVLHRSRFG